MHDRNGTPIRVGDKVLIEYVITGESPGEEFCNIECQSVHGRKPDGGKEFFSGNSAVVLLHERQRG